MAQKSFTIPEDIKAINDGLIGKLTIDLQTKS